MPYIVIFVDELATSWRLKQLTEIPFAVAQMSRAVGTRFGTQRPSVDVITDLPKQIFHLALRLMCHP